jgi:hypothetical protein
MIVEDLGQLSPTEATISDIRVFAKICMYGNANPNVKIYKLFQCMINIIYVMAVWEGTGNGSMDKGLKGNRDYLVVCFQDGGDAHDGR